MYCALYNKSQRPYGQRLQGGHVILRDVIRILVKLDGGHQSQEVIDYSRRQTLVAGQITPARYDGTGTIPFL